jgi:isopentenyl diphosphate isomerase/L-lactate dehydrogenase-like FMN-dependent dehydrogenase
VTAAEPAGDQEVGGPRFGPPFSAYQVEIFLRGLSGEKPAHPVAPARLAEAMRSTGDPEAVAYVFGGAGAEDTMRANEAAFRHWRIVPRMLRDVSARDLSATVLGTSLPAPIALAPIGVQAIVHPDGELAVARAAAAVGMAMAVSTMTSETLEAIAHTGAGPKWFQLYWPTDRDLMKSLVARAESAGYRAVIVTLDTFLPGWKPRDLDNAWQPFLRGIGIANYLSDPVFRARLAKPPEEDPQAAMYEFVGQFSNPGLTWDDIAFLRASTTLPIALKGILHPDDARRAREHGIDAVVVSNHGGRQVDGAVASLDALPAIVDAVGDDIEVLLDSGIRTGADALKALALGARAVFVGRPYLWGLGVGGEAGVLAVLRGLLAEFDLTLGLCGYATPDELSPSALVREQ